MDHHCHVDVVEMALGDELGLAEQEFDFSTLLSGVQRAFSRHWRSLELGEQHLCRFEIGRIEAFSEPAVDRCEKVAGIVATVLVAGFAVAGRRSMPVSFALSGAEWRATALIDPIREIEHGEHHLRDRLAPLDLEQLRDVVAEYRMDPNKLVMKWKDRERVIDHILSTSISRGRKGDAFRA
jgi:hypothetical protein